MNIYEVLYHLGVISKQEGLNRTFSSSNTSAELFKKVIEYIEHELTNNGNKLFIATNSLLRTNASFDRDTNVWTVRINLIERRIDNKCILWDFIHEYGHTKYESQDAHVAKEVKIQHEKTVWEEAWDEIARKFRDIEQYEASYKEWMNDCLANYAKYFSARAGEGRR